MFGVPIWSAPAPSAGSRRSGMSISSPILILDSGLGGLTVARALRRALPAENLLYFGDTARLPYGKATKPIDDFEYAAPLGPVGSIASLILTPYLRRFLARRADVLRRLAESRARRSL